MCFCMVWHGSKWTRLLPTLQSTGGVSMDRCNMKYCTDLHIPIGTRTIWILYRTPRSLWAGDNWYFVQSSMCTFGHVSDWNLFWIARWNMRTCIGPYPNVEDEWRPNGPLKNWEWSGPLGCPVSIKMERLGRRRFPALRLGRAIARSEAGRRMRPSRSAARPHFGEGLHSGPPALV